MITREQAESYSVNEFHYCPEPEKGNAPRKHGCYRSVGPRGAIKDRPVKVRRNGATQTWKTRPDHFRIPCKYGLYEYLNITQDNAADFYISDECPVCSLHSQSLSGESDTKKATQ